MSVLSLKNVSLGYYGNIILKDLSFDVKAGECVFITGSNGAGKSTLLRSIIGLSQVLSGEILKQDNIKISYVPQAEAERTEFNFPASLREIVLMGRQRPWHLFYNSRDKKAADYAMARFNINNINKSPAFISGGQMRRVLLARAMCGEPDLLLLDEPCSGLDFEGRKIFYDYLNELRVKNHTAVLMVTHDNSDNIEISANRVINLN